ncbi:MAG: hypothetical protein ACF8Q5_12050 [Phycisphaerales bacterium JB040]
MSRLERPMESTMQSLLEQVRRRAEDSGVFAGVRVEDGMLVCEAKDSAEPAQYRVEPHAEGSAPEIWVSLVMKDRWQSESIEAELMHTGDKLEELLDEELADLGYEGSPLGFEHFRSDDMLFTFRSRVPSDDPETVATCLLGYELTFRQLGDMDTTGDD